jgi:hypothetical protein
MAHTTHHVMRGHSLRLVHNQHAVHQQLSVIFNPTS